MAILETKNIAKTFRRPTLTPLFDRVSITVEKGETVAIMGPSGSGKTTLLHILGTLENPSEGEVLINGQRVTPRNAAQIRRENIGFVFQSFHLIEHDTAIENVLMPARIARAATRPGTPAYNRAVAMLDAMGLNGRLEHKTHLLSGGEKQRVAIARALCNDPDIILADEPTGNLDTATSEAIHSLLIQCAKKEGKVLIIATHDEQLARQCDRLLTLQNGTL
ncbi:ABC transporter ATP-binding protein, partial [Simkania negevensis]|nr:ABC transporter ATP-binding protein [Simkania negevensis]